MMAIIAVALWLLLSIPFAILVGRAIGFGMRS